MAPRDSKQQIEDLVEDLVDRAIRLDVPMGSARHAARAVCKTFSGLPSGTPSLALRAERYFVAVLNRRVVRDPAGARYTARLVAATVIAELRSGGRPDTEVYAQLERGWGDTLPSDVLEEFRLALCA